MGSSVEPWLLEILVCPESKAPLVLEGEWLYSTDRSTRRRFAVKNGIANMLVEESEVVAVEEFDRVVQKRDRKA